MKALLLLVGLVSCAGAEVLLTSPLALRKDVTNELRLRGQGLLAITNVTTEAEGVLLSIRDKAEAKPKDGLTPKKVGEERLTLSVFIPTCYAGDHLSLVLVGADGPACTNKIRVLEKLIDEVEPNGGFRNAQALATAATTNLVVRGTIDPKNDVDVYALDLAAGEKLHIEIEAERAGSALDSIVTILDQRGHLLANNDDSSGRDSALEFTAPSAGRYLLSIQDAHNRGGETHPYLLKIRR